MKRNDTTNQELQREIENLRLRLDEAEETLRAIRHGEIDALVVKGQNGHQVYTLKGAEHTYRVLIESMNEGAVTLDKHGTILYCNSSFANLIGLPLEKVIGTSITSFISKNGQKSFNTLLRKSLKEKNSIQEVNLLNESKNTITVLLSITPIQFDNGQLGMSLIITDLTEQKRSEELAASEKLTEQRLFHEQELRSSAEAAASALKTEKDNLQREIAERKKLEKQKDEFIGIASHELKTPVTSIKAYAQVLSLRFRKAKDVRSSDLVTKMDGQLNKLTSLINDLLDVTKIEGGKLHFNKGYFNLNELIDEIVEELQRTTNKHSIEVEIGKSKSIYGDRDRIGQVLTNYLTNAIKYSPQANKITVKNELNSSKVIVSVQDFGLGISEDKKEKVFDRFYRVEGEKQDTFAGLGLGLYLSREIIKRHNGSVWVESKKGKGSTFYFSLPIRKNKKLQEKIY